MPKSGFKSLTVSIETYSMLTDFYNKHSDDLKDTGINTTNAFTVMLIRQGVRRVTDDKTYRPNKRV